MKAREVIAALEADGWIEVRSKGSHRQFRHRLKPGLITVAVHGGKELPIGQLRDIERKSGLKLRN